jgi:hypothetical protein
MEKTEHQFSDIFLLLNNQEEGIFMRLIIGIIFGILIVFNWSSIKELFDSSLAGQTKGPDKTESVAPGQPPVQQQIPQSLSGAVEQRLKDAATDRK